MRAKTCSNKQSFSRNSTRVFFVALDGKGKHHSNIIRAYGGTLTSYVPQEDHLYELYWERQAELVYLGDNSTQLFQEKEICHYQTYELLKIRHSQMIRQGWGERLSSPPLSQKIGEIIAHCTAENHICKLWVTGVSTYLQGSFKYTLHVTQKCIHLSKLGT